MLIPCGHACTCTHTHTHTLRRCPICRVVIEHTAKNCIWAARRVKCVRVHYHRKNDFFGSEKSPPEHPRRRNEKRAHTHTHTHTHTQLVPACTSQNKDIASFSTRRVVRSIVIVIIIIIILINPSLLSTRTPPPKKKVCVSVLLVCYTHRSRPSIKNHTPPPPPPWLYCFSTTWLIILVASTYLSVHCSRHFLSYPLNALDGFETQYLEALFPHRREELLRVRVRQFRLHLVHHPLPVAAGVQSSSFVLRSISIDQFLSRENAFIFFQFIFLSSLQ